MTPEWLTNLIRRWTTDSFFTALDKHAKDASQPVVDCLYDIDEKKQQRHEEATGATVKAIESLENTVKGQQNEIINPEAIANPIVEAQNATTKAIKSIPRVEIPEVDFSSLESKLEALKNVFESKELVVNQGDINVDTQSVVKAIETLQNNLPKMEKQEIIDYTMMLDEQMTILEEIRDKKPEEIKEELNVVLEWLKVIAEKKYPELPEFSFSDTGRLKVEIDRTASGGNVSNIMDSSGTVINPATSDNQTTEIGILNNIKTDADSIVSNQTNGIQKTQILVSDSGMFDAFARLRTSSPSTIFDIQNQYNATGLFYENQLTGGGTVTHLPNESSVSLNVGTTNGDKVVRQSRNYFRYQPGKSQLIIMSRVFGATKTNVRKRSGYFDAQNGLFFEDNGTDFAVVQRSFVSGSAVDTRVAQSSWNIDKLDGASGFNLDVSKANVYFIDLEWLGAGRVRFGVFTDKGQPVYCHEFRNANSNASVYMTTANLPLRHSIENTGTAASSTSFKILCTTVMNEDGGIANPAGYHLSASTGITATAVTTRRAVLSIRPKATFNSIVNRASLIDLDYELVAKTNDCFYELVYNATLGGTPSWTSADANSTFEYDTAGTTITGGTVLESGFIVAGLGTVTGSSGTKNLFNRFPVTLDINGANPINLSIVCTSFTGTTNVNAAMNWQEAY